MRETIVSNCEKAFILKAILEGKRIDGRKDNEHRKLDIVFGNTWGCCLVSLGETRVMAQTTYEVQTPKSTRPTEGLLIVNVELSSMAAQHIEPGRPSDASVQLNRLLEKCLKESKCIDLESLCIVAEEKVWAVRVDVTALNHDGGLVNCASLAALASLAHSRRPDVTLSGEQVTIHTFAERDPLPLTLHHNPICVSYAIFDKGNKAVVDPTAAEEEAAETNLVVGMNAFRELCGLHLDGAGLPYSEETDIVLQCVNKAGARAVEVINVLKQTLAEDEKRRLRKEKVGLSEFVRLNKMSSLSVERIPIRLHSDVLQSAVRKLMNHKYKNKRKVWDEDGVEKEVPQDSDSEEEVVDLGDNTAELVNQKSRRPKIHLNLGHMEQGDSSDEDDDSEEYDEGEEGDEDDEDEEEELENGPPLSLKKEEEIGEPIEIDESDSDSDVMEIPPEEVVKTNKNAKQKDKKKRNNKKNAKGNARENNKGKKVVQNEEYMSDDSDEVEVVQELTYEEKMRLAEKIVLDDSEEEETVLLPGNGEAAAPQPEPQSTQPEEEKETPATPNQKKQKKKNKNKKTRTWYPKGKW